MVRAGGPSTARSKNTWKAQARVAFFRHVQLGGQSWPLDRIVNCLIQLAIVNHEVCDFKFHDRGCSAKVIGDQDEISLKCYQVTVPTTNQVQYIYIFKWYYESYAYVQV